MSKCEYCITMQVFHVKDTIIHVKNIEVEGFCTGLAYSHGRWVVGILGPPPMVNILSDEGDILHTLTTNTSDDDLFEKPDYIHVDTITDNHRVLVSDRDKKTVYMLDSELQLLQAFKLPPTGESWGLAAVGGGQVLVADAGSHTLQLLDINTGRWRTLLGKEELQLLPNSLVYNRTTSCLFVGGNGNEVRVYTLSRWSHSSDSFSLNASDDFKYQ